jgi:hypothetical protein
MPPDRRHIRSLLVAVPIIYNSSMANYVAHYTKKIEGLERRAQKLRRMLGSGASEEKLLRAAEEVLAARVRVVRAKQALIRQTGDHEAEFARMRSAILALSAVTPEAVLAEFRKHLDRPALRTC